MGQNRVRPKGGSTKGARWAKGQSSNSNPAKNKHRLAAKSRQFQYNDTGESGLGSGKLTAAALMRHDALQGDVDVTAMDQEGEDAVSLGMTKKTFDTFASDWTQCTNVAFDKILKKFQLQNSGHKEMLAVLAAVTEVIKQQGGKETETEYFAALMSTLEVSNSVENLSAVIRLLTLVIKKVPKDILISRFSQINELLLDTLSKQAETDNGPLLRGLIGCISVLLRVQPPGVWSLPEVNQSFQCLLTYATHTKPKIRKAGQHAVATVVLGGESAPNGIHPAAPLAAQHCVSVIKNSGPSDNSILYMMVLLRRLLPALPKQLTKLCCETVLKLLTLGSSVIISTGFAALYGLFAERPGPAVLSPELNAQLVSALYDYKPSINDTGPIIAWLAVMQEGLLNLHNLDPKLCHAHLHRFCTAAVSCWTSTKNDVSKSAGMAVRAVILETTAGVDADVAAKVVEELSNGLKYQYNTAWHIVLGVLAALTEAIGGEHPTMLKSMLRQLSELRLSENVKLEKEIDVVIGKAIQVMGPRQLLQAIPLNITGKETDYEFRGSWLLPVLRDNIRKTELAYFTEYFLPLAAKCLDRSNLSAANQDAIGTKTYEVLTYQMWSLLPGFCISPTDLTTSFKGLAKILGTQLTNRKEIRLDILTSLRHLISSCGEEEVGRAEIARFAKNFLPILFNLYTTRPGGAEEAGQRLAALETIKLYLKITDKALLCSMFDKAMEKSNTPDIDAFTKEAVQDLQRALIPLIDTERIQQLYTSALPRLQSKDHKEQKKSYRILEEICKCDTEDAKQFLTSSLTDLQTTLVSSLSKISPSSQYPRLKCLMSIISRLQEPSLDFVFSCLPEAILCIRAVNQKAREAAFDLLVTAAEALLRWEPDNKDEALSKFLTQLMVGLAGTPTLIHCTILAMSRIYFQFKDIIPQNMTEQLLSNILLLLSSSTREVSGSGLSFIKVFITATPVAVATKFLPAIMKAIVNMPEDCKRHSRQKTKFLLERFSRKFGYDLVCSLVPAKDITTQKRLRNLRKEAARRARKVSEDGSGPDNDDDFGTGANRQKSMDEILADSSDDDLDLDEDVPSKAKGKKKKESGTWIQEGEEILDLLSSNAAQSISSTKPSRSAAQTVATEAVEKRKAARKSEFKMTADGKIIITDKAAKNMHDDDDSDDGDGIQPEKIEDGDDSDAENTFDSLVASQASRKRKLGGSVAGSVKSRQSQASRMSTDTKKYRPGGSGIHRKLDGPGSEYKNKQGHGDVKRKGKPDPYAYIPINHKSLNKRKGSKSDSVFRNVVKAAKRGAAKGNKYKVKEVKKMMEGMKV